MTLWMLAGQFVGLTAYGLAWLRGGHTERLAAGIMIFVVLLSSVTFRWHVGGVYLAAVVETGVLAPIFGWLAFRSARWWPLVATAGLLLVLLLRVVTLVDARLAQTDIGSAGVGLWYLIDLTLLAGVFERWLAGEAPVNRTRWRALEGTP